MRISEGLARVRGIVEFVDTPEYQEALESLYTHMSERLGLEKEDKHFRTKRLGQVLIDPSLGSEVDIVCSSKSINSEERVHDMPGDSAVYVLSILGQTVELVAVSRYRFLKIGEDRKFYTMQFRTVTLEALRTQHGIIGDHRSVGFDTNEVKQADKWVKSWQEIPVQK